MTRFANYRRLFLLAFTVSMLLLGACNSGGGTGGGVQTNPHPCVLHADNVWQGDQTQLSPVDTARECPYTVIAAGSLVPFTFFIDILSTYIQSGSGIHFTVYDRNGVSRLDTWAYFTSYDPHDNTKLRATTAGQYEGGHVGSDGVIQDEASTYYRSLRTNTNATAFVDLPGDVDTAHMTLIAPTDIEIGQTNTFRLMPGWDTVSYEYAWDINGNPIGKHASVSASVGSLGYFTLRGIGIRTGDYSADTVTRTYSTYLHGVTVSGDSQAQTGCPGYWSAIKHGGLAPFTYVWNVGGSLYDTGSDNGFQYVPNSTGSLTIQVTVTDSYGSAVTNSMVVNVVDGSCT